MATATKPEISPEQLRAWRAFMRAHSSMLRRIGKDLADAGMPPLSWYDVLAVLRDAPQARLRQVDVAEQLLLSTSGLSRLLDRIEEAGLVRRVACPGDRRSLHLELTDDGAETLDRMWPVYARGIAEDFLPAFGKDAREIASAMEMIGASCEAARAAEGD